MHRHFLVLTAAALLGSCALSPHDALKNTTVALDPGHGGSQSGAVGPSGTLEKDVNLRVALALQNILESWGIRVIMTRENDTHLSPDIEDDVAARRRIANVSHADLLLSIHSNSSENPDTRGFEVWVPKAATGERNQESRDLAARVRSALVDVWGKRDLGTKDDHDLRLFANTSCPAALVELEFVSNPEAERELARGMVQDRLAQALAAGIREWALARKKKD